MPRLTLVRPHLEFASAIWDPYRQDQIDKIEADQRWAARFIRWDYDWNSRVYRERCFRCPWNPQRTEGKFVFKHFTKLTTTLSLYQLHITTSSRSIWQEAPRRILDPTLISFFPRTIKDWNLIPSMIRADSYSHSVFIIPSAIILKFILYYFIFSFPFWFSFNFFQCESTEE